MRTHKYVKRTGSPGNYRYWYYDPATRSLREGDESEQKAGKNEHARRLIAGKLAGIHSMTPEQMAEEVGIKKRRLTEHVSNMRQLGRNHAENIGELEGDHAKHGHDFETSHLKEAAHATTHENYGEISQQIHDKERDASAVAPGRVPRARRTASASSASTPPSPGRTPRAPRPTVAPPATAELESHEPVHPAVERTRTRARARAADGPSAKLGEAGYSEKEIKEIMEGIKIKIPGELEGQMSGGLSHIREEAKPRIIEELIKNRRNGIFEAGFKYPQLGEEDNAKHDAWFTANGFTKVPHTQDGRELHVWKNHDGVVVGATGESGGYMGITGPHKEARKVFDKMLSSMSYVKDVNIHDNGLGGNVSKEEYDKIIAHGSTPAAAPAAAPASESAKAKKIRELREKLAGKHGVALPGGEEERPAAAVRAEQAQAAAAVARRNSSPSSPESRELVEAVPAFGPGEEDIREMLKVQARGGNPYVNKAKAIYDKIKADLKPERANVCKHALAALASLGGRTSEAAFLAKYKSLSGNNRATIASVGKEFESGTFFTLDEAINNHAVNVEVERMKRGYAAKTFARMHPYLSDAFKSAHPSAPPPYPTYNDLKTWGQHGGEKPAHAMTTQKAHPKEFHDSMPKGADGKPMMPPGWMPLHLAPVWNYINKEHAGKMTSQGKPVVYAGTSMKPEEAAQRGSTRMVGGRQVVALPNQWRDQSESILESSLRKYVQMRGGDEQLVDIPASKLSAVGATHADIFKGDGLKKTIVTKIIDPVGLMKFVKEEMQHSGKPLKKSFVLTVDEDVQPAYFRRSYTVSLTPEDILRKSKIEKIRRLLDEKTL